MFALFCWLIKSSMASWLSVMLFQFLHQKFPHLQDNKTRLENVHLLHPSLKFRKNFNLFIFFSGSFTVKNDNIHIFFAWLQILNLPASLLNKNTRVGPFPWKWSVLQNPDRERTNQSPGICLRLSLPYNNRNYSSNLVIGYLI